MEYDIIIVGAGPAGLSTALNLAQFAPDLAARTLILESAAHPRPKLCAGGIMPGGISWLTRLGLNLDEVPSVSVTEAHFLFEGRGFVVRRVPAVFRVVRRDQFDAWLAGKVRECGIPIQENTRVRHVEVHRGAVLLETDRGVYSCRVLVGADGANGVVRRAMMRGAPSRLSRLVETRAPRNEDGSDSSSSLHQAIVDFSWMPNGIQGYFWDFPTQIDGHPGRTWGVFDSRVHSDGGSRALGPIMEAALAQRGVRLDNIKLESHPLRWFDPRGPFSVPNVLLVGDAAGVDPLLGEGISFALGYGEIAARELSAAFASGAFGFDRYRNHVMHHRVGRYLRRRTLVARLIYRMRRRSLQRFLWWSFGPLIGKFAEWVLVDWGEEPPSR